MLYVAVRRSGDLYRQLVQRIIVALRDLHGPLCITALYLSRYPHLFGLLTEGLLLRLILQLQQQPLLLEGLDG